MFGEELTNNSRFDLYEIASQRPNRFSIWCWKNEFKGAIQPRMFKVFFFVLFFFYSIQNGFIQKEKKADRYWGKMKKDRNSSFIEW